MSYLLAPSLLSADFGNLSNEVRMLENSNADWHHIDIMDGVFVPNISFGFPVLSAIASEAKKPLDVHLMIVNPDNYITKFANLGANIISVHFEACIHLHRTLNLIKDLGCKAGVALNPHTPVSFIKEVANLIDLVCVMSVNPGFGGQQFIENTYNKISELIALKAATNSHFLIEIDGGVSESNIPKLVRAGADVLVAGNAIFATNNPLNTIKHFKTLA